VKLYVVRHAHAGSRSNWSGDDRLRPLSKKGRREAASLATRLVVGTSGTSGTGDDGRVARLISSPSVRCVETLEPLAEQLSLPIEEDSRLAEGSNGDAALALAQELQQAGTVTVLCSHGDVIPELLWKLKANGTTFHHELTWPKGSVWVLDGDPAHWTDAHFLPASKG
jgi:broad specificity phosphatase PhoE